MVKRQVAPKVELKVDPSQNTQVPSIQTFQLEIGQDVGCISGGGKELSSVLSPQPVHGRIFTPPNQLSNERLTNSAKMTILKRFKKCCTIKT